MTRYERSIDTWRQRAADLVSEHLDKWALIIEDQVTVVDDMEEGYMRARSMARIEPDDQGFIVTHIRPDTDLLVPFVLLG